MSFSRWQKLSDRMTAKVVLLAVAVDKEGAAADAAGGAPTPPRQASVARNIRAAAVLCSLYPMATDQRTHTDVPARLDRLPWSAFHRLVVVALGITWILDGLEVTLAGSVA